MEQSAYMSFEYIVLCNYYLLLYHLYINSSNDDDDVWRHHDDQSYLFYIPSDVSLFASVFVFTSIYEVECYMYVRHE